MIRGIFLNMVLLTNLGEYDIIIVIVYFVLQTGGNKMTDIEKKFIAEAIKEKYDEEQRKKRRRMIEGHLVDDDGKPVVQE